MAQEIQKIAVITFLIAFMPITAIAALIAGYYLMYRWIMEGKD